jgi:hypothetical protein
MKRPCIRKTAPASTTAALLLALGALASCAPAADRQASGGGLVVLPPEDPGVLDPDLAPRNYYHDFGDVPDGDVVEHVYRLQNVEEVPVTIVRIIPSCGCSVPTVSYLSDTGERVRGTNDPAGKEKVIEIPPGVTADLSLRIDTREIRLKNADKLVFMNLETDARDGLYLKLEAHIRVLKPFFLTPNGIQLNKIPRSGGGRGSFEIAQAPGFAHRIAGVAELPEDVTVEITRTGLEPREVWSVVGELLPPLELGRQTRYVTLDTVDEQGNPYRPLRFGITGLVTEDVIADPARIVFACDKDERTPTSSEVRVFSLLQGHRLKVTAAELPPEHSDLLALAYSTQELDASGKSSEWTLTLATRPPLEGEILRGSAHLKFDDPQVESLEIPYVVHLR